MTDTNSRSMIGYGVAASVAIHMLLFAGMAIWIETVAVDRILTAKPTTPPEPAVTMIFAEAIQMEEPAPAPVEEEKPEPEPAPEPEKKKPEERYIRTTQNESTANAPEKADFVSDRNTVASARMAPSADGNAAMPTTDGVGFLTNELANRDFKDGDIKDDSAPSSPPMNSTPPPLMPEPILEPKPQTQPQPRPQPEVAAAPTPIPPPPPDKPQLRSPDPIQQPQQKPSPEPEPEQPTESETETKPMEMAKKTDSPMEEMMHDLDRQLAENAAALSPPPLEIRRALPPTPVEPQTQPQQESPPEMAATEPEQKPTPPTQDSPPEPPPVPRAVPVPMPEPIANTPNPQEDAFQPHTRTATQKGMISNRGEMDAVNAAATPTGRYMRQVTSQIEKRWHLLRKQNQDFVEPGKLRILFYVNKQGKTEDIKILSNQANAVMTDFSLTAILQADLPPIPTDLLPILEKQRVEIEYDIVIY